MTPENPTRRAEQEQSLAANPQVSAFVSAHAGTGKTKLLTDRLLRLMLDDEKADPSRILCLTFTKAAAAEMAIRLHRRLGAFATATPAALDEHLKQLALAPSPDRRARARALFADVLDLPGGMRISTIHAFCQSLLRRFPLEAQISPHFRLVEEADSRAALHQARESVLPTSPPEAIAALAGLVTADGFASLVGLLERHRERLKHALSMSPATLAAALSRVVGLNGTDATQLTAQAVSWPDESILRQALQRVDVQGSAAVADRARRLLGWLNLPPKLRAEHWEQWPAILFRTNGEPCAVSQFCNPNLAKRHKDIQPTILAEQARVASILEQKRALAAAEASAALLTLAAPVITEYETSKTRAGLLDYDDLIRHTDALLKDAGAAWVKYKLDGGIDHLLLDEVQDTSPAQWAVTDALTEDFFSGDGARDDVPRTIFAVGDKKQSIYGFQGADPDEFALHQKLYQSRVKAAGKTFQPTILDVSFRSTAPVLAVVDAVFTQPHAIAGVRDDETIRHIVRRTGQAGSVTLWPLAPRPALAPTEPWAIPTSYGTAGSALESLVDALASWIATETSGTRRLESAGRPLTPGDILILVRRRGDFDRGLVRALKKRAVPVAGLDRMMLTDQPAVQDLLSLCEALLLPDDDLSFAEMLVSPLGGLSDDSLMHLAADRGTTPLWQILRARAPERPDWQAAHAFYAALLARADFVTPYALLAEALGPLGARARLFARLGPEAAEPVDELLAAALHYATLQPPSLQGFLHWLGQSGAEITREPEAAGDTVRIMTVHGAKGLEAPLVILPDTTALPPDEDRLHWTRDPDTGAELFLWAPRRELSCNAIETLRAARADRRTAEHNRLLYVALTRARDHLLICGWQPRGDVPEGSWYALAQAGIAAAGATPSLHPWGETLCLECRQTASPDSLADAKATTAAPLPAWAGTAPHWQPSPPPIEPARPQPLSPSRPDGIAFGPVPPVRSPLLREASRADRGSLVHALLQHLPDLPPPDRHAAALAYATRALPEEAAAIAASVMATIEDPALAALFGPGSRAEQTVVGLVEGQVVTGRIDRLLITGTQILIVDYKTSRTPPASPETTPVLYLRQLAAYRAVLRRLHPNRPITCVLIWTDSPQAMTIPENLLDRHAPTLPSPPPPGLTPPQARPTSAINALSAGE